MKRYCQTLTLVNDTELIKKYVEVHSHVWPEIIEGQREVGILDMQIFIKDNLLFMICDTVDDFDWERDMARLATLPRQAEWEAYINRADKLILNSDEYCKTVLDYALEFGNYELIKFLMDHNYIWFDSRKDQDYIQTFGAGTSIERRHVGSIDYDLEGKLKTEDEL